MSKRASQIYEAMIASGFSRDRSAVNGMSFRGKLHPPQHTISVGITYPGGDLLKLPKLRLLDRTKELGDAVAHIENDDHVCYAQEADLLLDLDAPKATVATLLQVMTNALDRIIRLDLTAEIADEFTQHWLAARAVYVSGQALSSGPARLFGLRDGEGGRLVLAKDEGELKRFGANAAERTRAKKTSVPTFVEVTDRALTFPKPFRQPNTLRELSDWANHLKPGFGDRIVASLSLLDPEGLVGFLRGSNATVGFEATLPSMLARSIQRPQFLQRILTNRGHDIPIERISGVRVDQDRLFARNLPVGTTLAGKNVLLVGVGTIGGYLAKALAQSGCGLDGGQLVLIDDQSLTTGNVGRHLLGLPSVGSSKATACRDMLRSMYSDLRVEAVADSLSSIAGEIGRFDLVVNATGDMAVAQYIDEHANAAKQAGADFADRLHVWLKGNGVAAQAILVSGDRHACSRCLRTLDGRERFPILRPDHPAAITPASCSDGAYFAYGVGASMIAAGLATQLALDWAAGRPNPRFRTVRVVAEATTAVKDQDVGRLTGCPVCS